MKTTLTFVKMFPYTLFLKKGWRTFPEHLQCDEVTGTFECNVTKRSAYSCFDCLIAGMKSLRYTYLERSCDNSNCTLRAQRIEMT